MTAPTAEALARALALIDRCRCGDVFDAQTGAEVNAVFAVARASLEYDRADLEADDLPLDIDPFAFAALAAPIVARRSAALDAYNAARARLCALAAPAEAVAP